LKALRDKEETFLKMSNGQVILNNNLIDRFNNITKFIVTEQQEINDYIKYTQNSVYRELR